MKYILRFFMPFLFKYILKKQATAFNTRTQNNESHKKEGEVHIKTKSTSKSRNDTLGDYVEYEEVEDSKS